MEWRVASHTIGLISSTIRSMSDAQVLGGDMWIVGGKGVGLLNCMWVFDRSAGHWELKTPGGHYIPPPRDGHTVTVVDAKEFAQNLVVFGGQADPVAEPEGGEEGRTKKMASRVKTVHERNLLGDMFGYSVATNEWTRLDPPTAPPVRRGHSCVLWKRTGVDLVETAEEPKQRKQVHGEDPGDEEADAVAFAKKMAQYRRDRKSAVLANMALVLYGGSGIDPMRGEEKILNDVWEYFFKENTWRVMPTTGLRPAGAYNHACALVGNDMVVSGGITPPKFNEGPAPASSAVGAVVVKRLAPTFGGVHVLDLSNRHWSFVPLCGADGHDFAFSLHGHKMVAGSSPGKIFMFGGRETISATATTKTPLPKRSRHKTRKMSAGDAPGYELYELDLREETIDRVEVRGNVPEARFGHVAVAVPEWHPKDTKPGMDLRGKMLPREGGRPVLLVYGGNRAGQGGYCTNEVLELYYNPVPDPGGPRVRIGGMAVGESALDNENSQELEDMDMGGLASHSFERPMSPSGSPGGRPVSPGRRPGSPGSTIGSVMTKMSGASRRSHKKDMSKKPKPETLWVKSLRPILGPPLKGKTASPSNFQELKMALSFPLSGKVEEVTDDGHGHGSTSLHGSVHGHKHATKADISSPMSPLGGTLGSPERNPFPVGSSDYKKRYHRDLLAKSTALAPLIKSLKLTDAREQYDTAFGKVQDTKR